jgi:prepilin-type N-terminal cleavage/methylation domain-containing protein/prepilin-type processing-associated H-X9-DG protein
MMAISNCPRCSRRGFTMIELLVVLAVIGLLCALLIPAVQAAREAARRTQCINNLRQLGIAINSYAGDNNFLPAGFNGQLWQEGFSMHVSLLRYLEQPALYNSINFNTGFGAMYGAGRPNQTAGNARLSVFLCPSDREAGEKLPDMLGRTNYAGNCGYGAQKFPGSERLSGPFADVTGRQVKFPDIKDGMTQTVAMSEWILGSMSPLDNDPTTAVFDTDNLTEPGEFDQFVAACRDLDPKTSPLGAPALRRWFIGNSLDTLYNHTLRPGERNCLNGHSVNDGAYSAGSRHSAGINTLFVDGHVQFIKNSVSEANWRALSTRAGGEIISGGEY